MIKNVKFFLFHLQIACFDLKPPSKSVKVSQGPQALAKDLIFSILTAFKRSESSQSGLQIGSLKCEMIKLYIYWREHNGSHYLPDNQTTISKTHREMRVST